MPKLLCQTPKPRTIKAEKSLNTSEEKKYFIGGRNMNGIVLAMTIMATYTSASSFIFGPGAAGLTYGYAQAWIAAIQVPVTFLVLVIITRAELLYLALKYPTTVTVVVLYTAVGEFSAVVITDTIQGIVMCVGTFLFIFFVLKAGGGLASIDAGLANNLPNAYSSYS